MALAQRRHFRPQKFPASREARGHWNVTRKGELLAGADWDVGGHLAAAESVTIHPTGRRFQPPKRDSCRRKPLDCATMETGSGDRLPEVVPGVSSGAGG
ncbi:MAG: hypothetical protein ACKOE8_06625, partial [Opitutaceae bacterium]